MICAACASETATAPCDSCSADPYLDGRFRLDTILGPARTIATLVNPNPRLGDDPNAPPGVVLSSSPPGETHLNRARLQLRALRRLEHPPLPRVRQDLVLGGPAGPVLYAVMEQPEGETPSQLSPEEGLQLLNAGVVLLDALHNLNPPLMVGDWSPALFRWRAGALLPMGLAFGHGADLRLDCVGLGRLVRGALLAEPEPGSALARRLDSLDHEELPVEPKPLTAEPRKNPDSLSEDAPTSLLPKAQRLELEAEDKVTEAMRVDTGEYDGMLDTGSFPRPKLPPSPAPAETPPAVVATEPEEDEQPDRLVLWGGLAMVAVALILVAALIFFG